MNVRSATLILSTILLALGAGCAVHTTPPASDIDLQAYLQRREMCDHMRGEFPDPPDPDRMRELNEQVAIYCPGSDAQLAALKHRYRDDAAVSKKLEALAPEIEGHR